MMDTKRIVYYILSVVLFTSCKQFKALTASDSSASKKTASQSRVRKVSFLNNISVTPGQTVTSRHTTGPSVPKNYAKTTTRLSDVSTSAGDIERADLLQLKYAILLDANVEKLNNIGLLKLIDEWWGTRYCMGGSSKSCIDCSAFTQLVEYNVYNVNLPRTAQEQFDNSQQIGMEDLKEGDLVFFNTGGGRSISHVGIYLLNNKFVHAATSGGVMVSDLNDSYWKDKYKGAGRFNVATATTF